MCLEASTPVINHDKTTDRSARKALLNKISEKLPHCNKMFRQAGYAVLVGESYYGFTTASETHRFPVIAVPQDGDLVKVRDASHYPWRYRVSTGKLSSEDELLCHIEGSDAGREDPVGWQHFQVIESVSGHNPGAGKEKQGCCAKLKP